MMSDEIESVMKVKEENIMKRKRVSLEYKNIWCKKNVVAEDK